VAPRRAPASRIFGGLSFMLGGSTALERVAPGVRQGDLSGIAAAEVPGFLGAWSWPPRRLALLADWDAKLTALAEKRRAAAVRVLTGTPSWLLVLLERLAARHGGSPPLPGLELLVHGGVAWAPYRERIAPFLPPAAPRGRCTRRARASSPSPTAGAAKGCASTSTAAASSSSCPWRSWTRRAAPALGGDDRDRAWTTRWRCRPAPGSGPTCWATRCASWTARRRGCW
jgi:hypothetical protein